MAGIGNRGDRGSDWYGDARGPAVFLACQRRLPAVLANYAQGGSVCYSRQRTAPHAGCCWNARGAKNYCKLE